MRVLITGATGFIGSRLVSRLEQASVFSRNPEKAERHFASYRVRAFAWDPAREPAPREALEQVDAVIHLAGESVAGRWTSGKKQRIRDSRIVGTRNLVEGLSAANPRPRVLVSASAIGYYGSRGDDLLDESAPPDTSDFLAQLCVEWEAESQRARQLGMRVVNPRIGLVLGRGGGALQPMLLLFKTGLGGPLSSGRQWMSWIHREDLVELLLFACQHESLSGPVNAVAPNPVTNNQFTRTLASVLRRPALLRAPRFGLKLALGEFADELLASQRVVPKAAQEAGFTFQHPELEAALCAIIKGNREG